MRKATIRQKDEFTGIFLASTAGGYTLPFIKAVFGWETMELSRVFCLVVGIAFMVFGTCWVRRASLRTASKEEKLTIFILCSIVPKSIIFCSAAGIGLYIMYWFALIAWQNLNSFPHSFWEHSKMYLYAILGMFLITLNTFIHMVLLRGVSHFYNKWFAHSM